MLAGRVQPRSRRTAVGKCVQYSTPPRGKATTGDERVTAQARPQASNTADYNEREQAQSTLSTAQAHSYRCRLVHLITLPDYRYTYIVTVVGGRVGENSDAAWRGFA